METKETMNLIDIVIKEEYRNLIPRPSEADYQKLKDDIAINGMERAVVINDKKELIDGYTRYQIATELGIERIPHEVKLFSDVTEEKLFILRHNLRRRHLTIAQKSTIGMQLMVLEKEQAKKRQEEHGGTAPGKTLKVSVNSSDKGRATQKVAKQVGVSEATMKKMVKIKNVQETVKNIPELKKIIDDKLADALNEKTSIADVHRTAVAIEQNDFGPLSNPDELKSPKKEKTYTITCIHCKKSFQIKKEKGNFFGM